MHTQRLTDGWTHYRGTLGGPWEVWRERVYGNHFNVPWHAVTLPHCFNASDGVDPDTTYYQGPGWYATELTGANPYPGGRTLLHFEGAGQRTDVYVYTRLAGSHLGGYDEFTIDLTDHLEYCRAALGGTGVPIAIQCDNSRDLETIPSDTADFCLYGGLYRDVNLVHVPAISLQHVHVASELTDSQSATVQVSVRLYNPNQFSDAVSFDVILRDPSGQVVRQAEVQAEAFAGEQAIASFMLDEPSVWSPDRPALYECTVQLASPHGRTECTERFGVRQFSFEPNGPFYLNGERLLLRGTHRHEDHAGVGAAMTEAMTRREMQLIKDMGANFVRLGHYQQSRIVLDLCDELGLLVYEEIPWCRGGVGGQAYRQQCRDMLTAMIEQHKNHPSVIIWGLGNENDWPADFESFDEQQIRAFMIELHELAHQLDPSRVTGIRRCEFCKDVVDVYSPSIWAGWYRGTYPEYKQYLNEAVQQTPRFLHLEWGGDSIAGRHAEELYSGLDVIPTGQGADERDGDYKLTGGPPRVSLLGDWSESYICELVDWHLGVQESMPSLTGAVQWTFKDFATPVRPDNPLPYINTKGVVERDLTPKEAYYVFQSHWATSPMVHIHSHHAPVRWGEPGELKTVRVYSNCDSVELFLNGESQGLRQRDPQAFPAAGLQWKMAFEAGVNRLEAVAYADGERLVDQLDFEYQTQRWQSPTHLRLSTGPREDGRVFVSVRAYDASGVRCLDAHHVVQFTLAGHGRLLDNLGTVRGSRRLQLSNGRAEIEVETDPQGPTIICVTSEGLQGDSCELRHPANARPQRQPASTPQHAVSQASSSDRGIL
ncbi:glycoside hydrolase family 2 TIM barrel-domain containing protein [Phycisphaerales bacterium AB-hyl4]|uniref:Glycoside hydrolase family 2 TIM barrel-domain containing protein n=1 Tax=Natronomicrosphaera hydrolytica TaxID=3242702 RepID=A0ABV4U8V7_9BACT